MSQWQQTIDITGKVNDLSDGNISQQEFAKIILAKLKKAKDFNNEDEKYLRELVIEEFENISESEDELPNHEHCWFNYAMELLYNWADYSLDGKFGGKKVAWIKHF